MKIVSIGGGPAGLQFSILMKKAFPEAHIRVIERNRPDDTFGWGVVFSEETLGNIEQADPESYGRISERFIRWDDIETHYRGERITSKGHGFCGISRKTLLMILHDRCRELGVELCFEQEIRDPAGIPQADLVLAADGVNSLIRESFADRFRPRLEWTRNKFCWLGTTRPLRAFTFIFKESEHGLFQVHAYPFETGASTWIVECREETWRKAGLDSANEQQTVAFCQALFAEPLAGHRLLSNRSIWRTFPIVRTETWLHRNIVLLGDAAHTAHFSIGSGTKLAMEDAMALVDAFRQQGTGDVPAALARYEEARRPEVARTQRAAQSSLEWFENSSRYMAQHPTQFMFNLLTRSRRVTYENLKRRDPVFVQTLDEWQSRTAGVHTAEPSRAPAPIFTPFTLRGATLRNRIVVSPMCQYSARDGAPNDWHLVHLGSRAVGGAGLVMTEMTNVEDRGRITKGCAGMYTQAHAEAWKRIVDFAHQHSMAKIGIQLAHAGRKGSCRHSWEGEDCPLLAEEGGWQTLAPSALAYKPGWPVPKAMDLEDMSRIRDAFVRSARWADEAGFDLIELHMAHGYLLSSFLSPLSNRRQDEHGGTIENRTRFPLGVLRAVREVWPDHKPIAVRISASDWMDAEGGFTPADSVIVAGLLNENGCDIVDVSSGGNVPESLPVYGRMYQVPFAEKIRHEAGIPVIAVGAILDCDHANTVIGAGRADLVAMARPHLSDPYLTMHGAAAHGYDEQHWPAQYFPAKPRPR